MELVDMTQYKQDCTKDSSSQSIDMKHMSTMTTACATKVDLHYNNSIMFLLSLHNPTITTYSFLRLSFVSE